MTAGHGSRKRSAVGPQSQSNRPITAKVPVIGRRNYQENNKEEQENDGLRPETVPFTNLGPLGETEPIDENDKIKQEITREVSGESDKEIEARIGNEEAKEESEGESRQPENKFNEPEKQMENLTDDASEKPEKEHHSDHSNKINVETDPKQNSHSNEDKSSEKVDNNQNNEDQENTPPNNGECTPNAAEGDNPLEKIDERKEYKSKVEVHSPHEHHESDEQEQQIDNSN